MQNNLLDDAMDAPESYIRSYIKTMPGYEPILPFEVVSDALGLPIEKIIKLDANENPYGPLPEVRQTLTELPFIHIYPDPESRVLRQAIADYHHLPVENILAGAGADELLDLLMRAVLEPGEAVLNWPPTFGTYAFDAVPRQDVSSHFPPGTAPVFYNRRMELSRDGTVLFASVMKPSEYLDAMGATGARGLRIAIECGIEVTINDRDKAACELIRRNAECPDRGIRVTCRNIHSLLAERRYYAVDLDPYGSPAPFIDSAVRGTGRFLMVTATDTAPLCGAHQRAGNRRYFAQPANNEYHAESGLRTLLAFIARETVKYDRGIVEKERSEGQEK